MQSDNTNKKADFCERRGPFVCYKGARLIVIVHYQNVVQNLQHRHATLNHQKRTILTETVHGFMPNERN